jgi:hypothetical protein
VQDIALHGPSSKYCYSLQTRFRGEYQLSPMTSTYLFIPQFLMNLAARSYPVSTIDSQYSPKFRRFPLAHLFRLAQPAFPQHVCCSSSTFRPSCVTILLHIHSLCNYSVVPPQTTQGASHYNIFTCFISMWGHDVELPAKKYTAQHSTYFSAVHEDEITRRTACSRPW